MEFEYVSDSNTADGPSAPIVSEGDVQRIGLALSGGGVRAATFHMGVLKRLAAEDLLERVSVISTVSGGSLVTAAVMTEAGMKWPSSEDFLEKVYPAIRARMTSGDLFSLKAIGWRGLLEFNVDLVRNRASVLARLLERNWGVSGTLADLPDTPHWLINTTCLETGKNWRFAKREMGDWSFARRGEHGIVRDQATVPNVLR
ncbi:patatin-like phospholipase family protein [Bradyrhizobium sp. CB1650]|uniref:patatin-like phospholipase family protein n=1 Tax=Bradyrhizobium sp. CB1650 TaxID=3039153 RepID=UPI00243532E7|nr:patatin-like phospholipase family protein [Bradyrhizobium sp. CB1650]WGD55281.1 patatin-like phospholipase family protein [Bradyrhizobium sp. CB1650]